MCLIQIINYRSCLSNRSNEYESSVLSLSPICENISPIDHEYGPANPAIYHKCVICRGDHPIIEIYFTHVKIAIIRYVGSVIMDYHQTYYMHVNIYKFDIFI